jgi:hypothetical protein
MGGIATLLAALLIGALLVGGDAHAQFGRRLRIVDNDPPSTELVAARFKYGTNGRIYHMGWSHNYPSSEINLNEFIERSTRVDVEPNSFRLLELGSPEIFDYPFAYISEPGEMEMTEIEVANLREYIERGGFILIDDFDGDHMDNLREEMRRAFPDRQFERLSVDDPIFDLVFQVEDLRSMAPYVPGGDPVYYGLRNSAGHIAIVACHNNDLANFWEWYGSPAYPLRPSTDAFRMGANFVIQAFTH